MIVAAARRRLGPALMVGAMLALALTGLTAPPAAAVSTSIVVSQVYGGGGNTGAPFTHDFIELFNRGTSPASVDGWSLQYTSATGTGNFGGATNLITGAPAPQASVDSVIPGGPRKERV